MGADGYAGWLQLDNTGGAIYASTVNFGAYATLAMGYNFNTSGLTATGAGGIFHTTSVSGINSLTLEVLNGATVTQDSDLSLATLRLGTRVPRMGRHQRLQLRC